MAENALFRHLLNTTFRLLMIKFGIPKAYWTYIRMRYHQCIVVCMRMGGVTSVFTQGNSKPLFTHRDWDSFRLCHMRFVLYFSVQDHVVIEITSVLRWRMYIESKLSHVTVVLLENTTSNISKCWHFKHFKVTSVSDVGRNSWETC